MATPVHFVISARDLASKQRGPQGSTFPDPYVKVYLKNGATQIDWIELGETERFNNNPNPDFLKVVTVDWNQGLGQVLKFDVLDFDTLNKDDLVGSAQVNLDTFVQQNKDVKVILPSGGNLHIKGTTPLGIRLAVNKLPNLDALFCGIDAFVKCYWQTGKEGPRHLFHETKIQKNVHEAAWDEKALFFNFQPRTDQYLTFEVLDDDVVKNDKVGEVTISADDFASGQRNVQELRLSNKEDNRATIHIQRA